MKARRKRNMGHKEQDEGQKLPAPTQRLGDGNRASSLCAVCVAVHTPSHTLAGTVGGYSVLACSIGSPLAQKEKTITKAHQACADPDADHWTREHRLDCHGTGASRNTSFSRHDPKRLSVLEPATSASWNRVRLTLQDRDRANPFSCCSTCSISGTTSNL
jgi:hypothetical protein